MKALLITALVLLVIALIPLGVALRYDETGFWAFLKVSFLKIRLFPQKKEKKKKEKVDGEEKRKNGVTLKLVKESLPLVAQGLQGIRKRLTINRLELRVVWATDDPADAALGYGYANAVLGTIWPLFYQNFKIRNHSLGIDVDFDATEPVICANVALTMNLFQILTLALPLLIRFLKIYRTTKAAPKGETVKKEA